MLIDTKKVKELLKVYAELDEQRQEKLVEKAWILHFEQIAEERLKKEKKQYSDDDVKEAFVEMFNESEDLIELIMNANEEQLASVYLFLSKLKGRNVCEDEKIKIILESEEISIEEYIRRNFANVNYKKIDTIVNNYIQDSKC